MTWRDAGRMWRRLFARMYVFKLRAFLHARAFPRAMRILCALLGFNCARYSISLVSDQYRELTVETDRQKLLVPLSSFLHSRCQLMVKLFVHLISL